MMCLWFVLEKEKSSLMKRKHTTFKLLYLFLPLFLIAIWYKQVKNKMLNYNIYASIRSMPKNARNIVESMPF